MDEFGLFSDCEAVVLRDPCRGFAFAALIRPSTSPARTLFLKEQTSALEHRRSWKRARLLALSRLRLCMCRLCTCIAIHLLDARSPVLICPMFHIIPCMFPCHLTSWQCPSFVSDIPGPHADFQVFDAQSEDRRRAAFTAEAKWNVSHQGAFYMGMVMGQIHAQKRMV